MRGTRIARWVLAFAGLLGGTATAAPLPPPAPPEPVTLTAAQARDLLQRQFHVDVGETTVEGESFFFVLEGFRDPRTCPLDGLSGVRCGDLEYVPSEAYVRRQAWIAPVSGHLARNLVATVSLFSDAVPHSIGTMHGVLVLDGPDPASRKAAFGWYLGREVPPGSVAFQDVDADGAWDVLYSYEMYLGPFGEVVARDLWTFRGLAPERVIASGDYRGGILAGSFEGLPLWWVGGIDGRPRVRGSFRFEEVREGFPALGIFERARSDSSGAGMDFFVMGDFGEGWVMALGGAAPQAPEESEDRLDCTPEEVPVDTPLEVRRRLLELETVCRLTRWAMAGGPGLSPPRPDRLWAALVLRRMGFPMLALAVRERLAEQLPVDGPGLLALRAVLMLADFSTIVAATASLWPEASREQQVENWAQALSHRWMAEAVRWLSDLRADLDSGIAWLSGGRQAAPPSGPDDSSTEPPFDFRKADGADSPPEGRRGGGR